MTRFSTYDHNDDACDDKNDNFYDDDDENASLTFKTRPSKMEIQHRDTFGITGLSG